MRFEFGKKDACPCFDLEGFPSCVHIEFTFEHVEATNAKQQTPIRSGFGPATTARETLQRVDLSGKVAIVTGGYAGIGLETTRVLAEAGATVIVPVRTPNKARQALRDIPRVEQNALDLLDPGSIDAFANEFVSTGRPLQMLINNAGIMATPIARDSRGYESQFSANHLGHFQLTARRWPALRMARGARVVSLSSRGHQLAGIDFEDPNFQHRPYDRWHAYGQSKTTNILFAVELDRRGQANEIRAFRRSSWRNPYRARSPYVGRGTQRIWPHPGPQSRFCSAGKSVAEGGDFKTIEQGAATGSGAPRVRSLAEWVAFTVRMSTLRRFFRPILPAMLACDPTPSIPGRHNERLTGVKFEQ